MSRIVWDFLHNASRTMISMFVLAFREKGRSVCSRRLRSDFWDGLQTCALKFKIMRHTGLKCQSNEIMDLWVNV